MNDYCLFKRDVYCLYKELFSMRYIYIDKYY